MTRKFRITSQQIQRARADWYSYHYEIRQRFRNLDSDTQMRYRVIAGLLPGPVLSIYGGVSPDYPAREFYDLARDRNLDVHLLNPWYLSDAGWSAFQDLWKQLPEPVDLLAEAVWTKRGLVHIVHSLDGLEPPME